MKDSYLGLSRLFGVQLQWRSQTSGGLKVSVDVGELECLLF